MTMRCDLGLLVLAAGVALGGAGHGLWAAANHAPQAGALVLAEHQARAAFPLAVAPDNRHLVDAAGKPFLINGDTAWSLIADLTRPEVEIYLKDRKARGFNAVLVNLIEHKYARRAPANAFGQAPFRVAGNFGTPNEAYFAHADWVLERARDMGFLVLLAPAYVGNRGTGEGWYEEMAAGGLDKLRAYGRFVGERYAHLDNILWVHAGDDNPADKRVSAVIGEEIRSAGGKMLETAHPAPGASATDYWGDEDWFRVANVYTYGPTCPPSLKEYARPKTRPFFLLESAYENEHGAGEERIRAQAYQALLCGAAGHIYGNNPIWHFGAPGLYDADADWWQSLGSRGAQSMTHLSDFFAALPWWRLVPATDELLPEASAALGSGGPVAALTRERDLAVFYLPDREEVKVDLSHLKGPMLSAKWFDPSNGRFTNAGPDRFAAAGTRAFVTPGPNASRTGDWVLILGPADAPS